MQVLTTHSCVLTFPITILYAVILLHGLLDVGTFPMTTETTLLHTCDM